MRSPLGVLFGLALAWLTYVLFREASAAYSDEEGDPSKGVMLFIAVVLVGGISAILFVVIVLPAFGDWIGNFFFNPNEKLEKVPHADALAAFNRGDYEGSIAAYRKDLEENPSDTLAVSEISRIYCEKLHDPRSAEVCIEEALTGDWTDDDIAFLNIRLAEVYWKFRRDARKAREILLSVANDFPESQHAATASHRLQEIERQLAMGE